MWRSRLSLADNCLAAAAAAAVTYGAAPFVARAMRRANVVDQPNDRSSHSVPTPRGGGLACLAGAGMGVVFLQTRAVKVPLSVIGPSLAMATVGLVDDHVSLPAPARLGAQIAVGAAAGVYSGLGVISGPVLGSTVFPVVVNAVNFMDGINGITALTAGAWGLLAIGNFGLVDPLFASPSGAVVLGASLGFLPWNSPEAQVFLGDVGSYFLGGSIAATALAACQSPHMNPVVSVGVALSPLIPYLADTGSTLFRRASGGHRLLSAHRDHYYQKLVDRPGWSHLKVAGLYGLGSLLSGVVTSVGVRRGASEVELPVVRGVAE